MVCDAADTASLATQFLFGKLFGVATLVGFGEKRCRKNLPLYEPSRLNPQLNEIRTYEDLLEFLRSFVNCSHTPSYDFVGALHLLFAITENLATYSMDADFDALDDGDFVLTEAQAAVLARLLELRPKS